MAMGLPNLNFQKTSLQSTQSSLQNLLFTPNVNVVTNSPSSSTPATLTAQGYPSQTTSPTMSAPTDFNVAPIDFLQSAVPRGLSFQLPGQTSYTPEPVAASAGIDSVGILSGKNLVIAGIIAGAVALFYFFK